MAVVEEVKEKGEGDAKDQATSTTRQRSKEEQDKIDKMFEQFVKGAGLERELTPDERAHWKEKFIATTFPEEKAGPAPPPAAKAEASKPAFKVSTIVPMVVVMSTSSMDLEQLGYTHHIETAFVVLQLICFYVLITIYERIDRMQDDGSKVKIPESKTATGVVIPAKEVSAKEYDMDKLKRAAWQQAAIFVVVAGIYYQWRPLLPVIIQALMTPAMLCENPLTQIHIFGMTHNRPFGAPPPAEESAGEEKKDK